MCLYIDLLNLVSVGFSAPRGNNHRAQKENNSFNIFTGSKKIYIFSPFFLGKSGNYADYYYYSHPFSSKHGKIPLVGVLHNINNNDLLYSYSPFKSAKQENSETETDTCQAEMGR